MQRRSFIWIVLIVVSFACQERTFQSQQKKSRLVEQGSDESAQKMEQREQQLAQKAEALNVLLDKLEQKESELLAKENRLLEFEKKLSDMEIMLNKRKQVLDKFRTASIGILLIGILFLAGSIVLIYRAQLKKKPPTDESFNQEVNNNAVIKSAPERAVLTPPRRKK